MRKILFAAALAATCQASAALDIKGIEVDKPADCQHIAEISGYDAAADCRSASERFMVDTTFLSSSQKLMVMRNPELEVTTVYLTGFDFHQAEAAFTAKFGRPKAATSMIQNGLGAKFEQRSLVWETPTAFLRVDRHGSHVGKARATLDSKKDMKKLEQQIGKSKGDI